MKYLPVVLLLVIMLPLVPGCAARSGISETKVGSTITYTHAATGQSLTVAIGAPYVFEEVVERGFRDVDVEGYLFRASDGTTILLTRMDRSDFEEMAGVPLDAPLTGVKAYPPRTIYEAAFCELVRAYVVSFEKEVVAAVKVKGLNPEKKPCQGWTNLDDVMADRPDVVSGFDESADAVISMTWD